jgi:hypothetical protein
VGVGRLRGILLGALALDLLAFEAAALAREPVTAFVGWVVAGVAWAIAVLASAGPARSAGPLADGAVLPWILGGWALLRVPLLFVDPRLSDDVQRYVWEGRLFGAGTSPYAFAPAAPELAAERARWPGLAESVNHAEVSAAYPPLAELVFAATTTLVGRDGEVRTSVNAFRVLFTLGDLAVLLALLAWLRRRGASPWRAVVWAWCPLAALEFAASAHFDALGIALLVGGLAALDAPARSAARAALGGFCLAAGALVKLLPAALVPFAFRLQGRARHGVLALGLALPALAFLPFLFVRGGLDGLRHGLSEYAFRWESFNLVHRWVERLFARHFALDESWTDPRRLARASAFLVWALLALRTFRARPELARAARTLVGGFLLLTATLHPWYLLWIAPYLAFQPSRAWTFLLAAAPLLYLPLAGFRASGVWSEPAWLWPALALPFFALGALEALGRRSSSRP